MDIRNYDPKKAILAHLNAEHGKLDTEAGLSEAKDRLKETLAHEARLISAASCDRVISLTDSSSVVDIEARCSEKGIRFDLVGKQGINYLTGLEHEERVLRSIGDVHSSAGEVQTYFYGASQSIEGFFEFSRAASASPKFEPLIRKDLAESENIFITCYLMLIEILEKEADSAE